MSEIEFITDDRILTEEEELTIELINSLKDTSNAFQMLNATKLKNANLPKIFVSVSTTMLAYTMANVYELLINKEGFQEIADSVKKSVSLMMEDMPELYKRMTGIDDE